MFKGIMIVVGVAVVGIVGYKVIQKQNPKLLEGANKSLAKIKERAQGLVDVAHASFKEGYASA